MFRRGVANLGGIQKEKGPEKPVYSVIWTIALRT